ncbi:hypothetical protein C439_13279 [Haloferax mediterranei ATCC 33500]|nr:hypothetical protein C439_13279 [Haloferax mediterranei ATCC 33500]
MVHEDMMNVADAREQTAEMLADPDIPLVEAYEKETERAAETYRRRCRHIAGDDYEEIAMAYSRGERNDRVGAITAYFFEGLWRMQQRISVTDMMFFPIILRYPDCLTVNIRFTSSGYTTSESVLYESPEHSPEDLEGEYGERYYNESLYSQKEAAKQIKATSQIIREEFPSPDESTFEERKYGGIVTAGGKKGSVFSSMLQRVEPDPNRFSEPATEPMLVDEGNEAKRTERELLPDGVIVL